MTCNEAQLVKWIKLGNVKGLGPRKIQQLIDEFGSIDRIFEASPKELLGVRAFKEAMLPEWNQLLEASDENFLRSIREASSQNIQIIPLIDEKYPAKLKRMPSPPLTLYLWGNTSLLDKTPKIAIVGTRQPSDNARQLAFEYSKYLAEFGMTVVSGGAEGIDTAVHEGVLASVSGKTISVLGTGFFHYYPPKNAPLFEKIRMSDGLLISEYSPNFRGSSFSFLQRNRITSGLSDALLICASNEQGGSMHQTRTASEQRIPIFCPAVEMNILPNSGITYAIREFGAQEIHTPQELLSKLQAVLLETSQNLQTKDLTLHHTTDDQAIR
jgi:DNA processing protein